MAEQLNNEFTVNRPIDEAWPIITNVEKIAPCMPGAELQEVATDPEKGEVYRGVVKVKLGAISTQFKGDAYFIENDDEAHKAVIKGKGRDTGGRGNASADISAQATQVFNNLAAIAEAAGGSLDSAVKINISLTDLGDFAAVNAVMESYFDEPYPARACVEVAALPKGVAIEVEAILSV